MKVPEHYPGGRWGVMAVALCLALGQVASAATVSYSTTGSFFSGLGASGDTLSGIGIGTSTLSFDGVSASVDINPPEETAIHLGTFILTASGWGGDLYFGLGNFGQSFTLAVDQSAPTSGGGSSSTLALLGAVRQAAGGVLLVFEDTTFQIGSIAYAIEDTVFVPVGSAQFMGAVTAHQVSRDVNPVPLPAAAWGGLALMGVVAASKIRRRAAHAV